MANQEQLAILKQGVQAWNQWREKKPDVEIDLSRADLSHADLSRADLSRADLTRADLSDTDLSHADLTRAILSGANLSHADFTHATLRGADLISVNLSYAVLISADLINVDLSDATLSYADFLSADLSDATLNLVNLSHANLTQATLIRADLISADLSDTDLISADLSYAVLHDVNLSYANLAFTIFGDIDLSTVKGLETVKHLGPSTIGIDTIIRSQGKIPEFFLRNVGVPDSIIEAIPSLVGSLKPIDYYSCFISYSSKDDAFAKRLYADLQSHNVRCWFAPEDMKIGDKIRPRIDESIRIYDKLLLVLSEHSVASKWVEFEIEAAMDKEQEGKPTVLFPVRLDNTVMESTTAWAAHVKRTRHIGDFICWKSHDDYQKAFNRLLRDLKSEIKSSNKE